MINKHATNQFNCLAIYYHHQTLLAKRGGMSEGVVWTRRCAPRRADGWQGK